MPNGNLSDQLVRFAEYVKTRHAGKDRQPNVLDLRVACRAERLTEYSAWPARELDLIEQEAACYGDEADLSQVLSGAVVRPTASPASLWLHSPSPFAWT